MPTIIHVEGLLFIEYEGQTRFSAIITNKEFELADCDNQHNHLFTYNINSPTCRNFSYEEDHQNKCEFFVQDFINRGFQKEGCPFYAKIAKGWCKIVPVKITHS